jgi:predicted porin
MKKVLFAMAALGGITGACAQSSVTIYGIIDEGVGKLNSGTSFLTGLPAGLVGSPDVWTVKSTTSSRLGFRGSEDLGDGLRANFSLETRIAPDVGATQFGQTGFFGGHSWVGISSPSWGEVRLGRQFVPAHYVALAGDPFIFDYTPASAYAFTKAGSTFTYAANSIGYRTPTLFGGLSSEVVVGAGEGGVTVNPANNPDRVTSASLVWNKGPLYAGAAFARVRTTTAAKNEYWVGTVVYDFGFIRPEVSFSAARTNTVTLTHGFTAGATMPVGLGRIKFVYARLDPSGDDNETNKVGLGFDYYLSKRTNLYVNAGTAKTKQRTTSSGFDAGVKHVF